MQGKTRNLGGIGLCVTFSINSIRHGILFLACQALSVGTEGLVSFTFDVGIVRYHLIFTKIFLFQNSISNQFFFFNFIVFTLPGGGGRGRVPWGVLLEFLLQCALRIDRVNLWCNVDSQ